MKKIITKNQLIKLGFEACVEKVQEKEFSFEWYQFKKNDSTLWVTTEYDLEDVVILQYVELNAGKLEGETIGIKELKFLMKLM